MPPEPDPDEYLSVLRKLYQDHALKGFRAHLVAYALASLVAVSINLILTPWTVWSVWPVLGWGCGVCSHYISVKKAARDARRVNEMFVWTRR